MVKKALCIGINNYNNEAQNLNGCLNDAKAWSTLLKDHYDFPTSNIKLLTDSKATKAAILKDLDNLLKGAKSGDVLVFTNSSHGTYRADQNGDEYRYDEALCPYDYQDNLILDDELRELFADFPRGVRLTVISDSCHSGTVTRAMPDEDVPDKRRVRFLNPREIGLRELPDVRKAESSMYPESGMNELLLAGCKSSQYSFDAQFGRKFYGAFTFAALRAIQEANYRLTYAGLFRKVIPWLEREGYDQAPQLEGRASFKKRQLFT
jgi:metacaspase-1